MKQFLKDLKTGDDVDSYFAVLEKAEVKSYAHGFSFAIRVSDKTGNLWVKYWGGSNQEDVKAVYSSFEAQNVISIKGKAAEFRGNLEIHINPGDGHELTKIEDFDQSELVLTTDQDIDQMKLKLKEIIDSIENPDIKRLLKSFFDDEDFMKKFSQSPAAQLRHHNFRGGLLEHVLSLIKISKNVVEIHPRLDLDLLITGCIFHDIGKISEYQVTNAIGYTNDGEFFGHISIGQQMVAEKIKELGDFPDLLRQKILHLILSHHGKIELGWGSATDPKIPEAIALHYIDQVDAKIKGSFQDIDSVLSDDEWVRTRDYGRLYRK